MGCEGRRHYVLVVEDDEDIRESIELLLSMCGVEVHTAAEGSEALRVLRGKERQPCLILLDLMMPGMNGFELRSVLGADPALAEIPIVVITGAGPAAVPEQLKADILRKPFDSKTLMTIVNRFCGRARDKSAAASA
jgi:CheY-like chemotaxis protein